MEFEDIIPFLVVGAIIVFNVVKAVFASKQEEEQTPRTPRRNPPQSSTDSAWQRRARQAQYGEDNRREGGEPDENFEAARMLVEEIKRRSRGLETVQQDDEDDEISSDDALRNFRKEDSPTLIFELENSRQNKIQEELSKAVSDLEESEKTLYNAVNKANADAYKTAPDMSTHDSYNIKNAKDPFAISAKDVAAHLRKREYLREAFVMAEILAKPVALRSHRGEI